MTDDNASTQGTPDAPDRLRRLFLKQITLATAGACGLGALSGPAWAAPPPTTKCPNINIPMQEVEGKVAFITGGSSGIGLGIAKVCADAGMKVVISYRTKKNMERAMAQLAHAGSRVHAIELDVTNRPGMESAAARTVKLFGKIHVLVNNAGIAYPAASLGESTYDDWDRMIGVNLTGIYNGLRAFLPYIKAHGEGGQVVTTSSVLGLIAFGPLGIYTASKFAAVGMMEALRSELASKNIGVSVVCPGYVNTFIGIQRNHPDVEKQMAEAASGPGMDPVEVGRIVLRGIRNNDLYILSHPEFEQGIRDRNEALIASIPDDLHSSEALVSAERVELRNPIYTAELDRKGCRQR